MLMCHKWLFLCLSHRELNLTWTKRFFIFILNLYGARHASSPQLIFSLPWKSGASAISSPDRQVEENWLWLFCYEYHSFEKWQGVHTNSHEYTVCNCIYAYLYLYETSLERFVMVFSLDLTHFNAEGHCRLLVWLKWWISSFIGLCSHLLMMKLTLLVYTNAEYVALV